MSIQILRPVTIKAKVTDGLKARMRAEVAEAVKILDEEAQALDSQVKRAQLTATISAQQQMQLQQLVQAEKMKRNDKKAALREELAAIEELPVGSEIVQGTAQTLVTIDVGSDYDAITGMEVVVQDGIVIAIRKG